MRSPRLRGFDLRPLGQPVWWAALAVLVINDNLLKGQGVVPGWLTGKLSDFAFLIVAPVLLAALLPRAVPWRRLVALVSVVGLYVAADLSTAVSNAVVAAAARLGMTWRLWPDVTDLMALAILPLTVRLMRASPEAEALAVAPGATPRLRVLRERAAVLLGATACLATSALPTYVHTPFLFSAAPADTPVRITWVLRAVRNAPHGDGTPSPFPCEDAAAVAARLGPSDLDDPRDIALTPGDVAALDGPPPAGTSPVGMCATSRHNNVQGACVAAILEAPSASPVLLVTLQTWEEGEKSGGGCGGNDTPAPVSLCASRLNPAANPGPDAVTLRMGQNGLEFVAGAELQLVPIDLAAVRARPPEQDGCQETRDAYRALLVAPSCQINTDCVGTRGIAIPGEPVCDIDINVGSASLLDALTEQWNARCIFERYPSCNAPPQPAVCRQSRCAQVCPGIVLPRCPPPCEGSVGLPGTPCTGSGQCMRGDQFCTCRNERVICTAPELANVGCPVPCVDSPGGGTYTGQTN